MFHHTRQTLKHSMALQLRRLQFGRPGPKVFCVGFQKTGTTSLQYALSLLGYRVAGVLSASQLDDWDELDGQVYRLLPKFDAFADHPWSIYFREFDRMYPGAQFILTTRHPEAWYASVCKHFGRKQVRLHEWIYGAGAPVGNKTSYVETLLSHQDAVRAHFEDRPNDLLEFNISRGDGWAGLCGFLGKKRPRKPFPKLNAAGQR